MRCMENKSPIPGSKKYGAHLVTIWAKLAYHMVTIWATHMGPRWGPDAPSGIHIPFAPWGPSGTHLGFPIWGHMGPIWDPYGTHVYHMGSIWDPYGIHVYHMGPIWDPYGPHIGTSGQNEICGQKSWNISVSCMHYTPKSDTDSALISLILIA